MPEGGIVTIQAENLPADPDHIQPFRKKNCVKISIKDKGIGIQPENIPRIFNPYFTTKRKGSGLGLAVCFSIIRNHNGNIEVKSAPGKGTVFTLYLPAAEKDTVKMAKPEKTIQTGKGKILLMDDEESILLSTGMLLRKLGYTVETTRNGYEAVERYGEALKKQNPFDLCIMDLTVPGSMGGLEARERIAALDKGVRAIVSSGYADDPIMSEYTKYGFIGVLVKPYYLNELARLLHEILDS